MSKQKVYVQFKHQDNKFEHAAELDNQKIVQVDCFNNNAFVLLENGQVYALGKNKV